VRPLFGKSVQPTCVRWARPGLR